MTKNEALRVFHHIPFNNTFNHFVEGIKYISESESDLNYEWVINYLMSLNISPEDAIKFFEEDVEFATMENKRTGDEFDYFDIDEDGIYAWTEVCGNIYYLHDMNVKWKDYEPTPEEIKEREEYYKTLFNLYKEENKIFKKFCLELTNAAMPNLVNKDVSIEPIKQKEKK